MCEATDSVSLVRGKSHMKDSSELCLFNLRNAVQTYTHSPQCSSGYSKYSCLGYYISEDAKFQEAVVASQQSRSGPLQKKGLPTVTHQDGNEVPQLWVPMPASVLQGTQ